MKLGLIERELDATTAFVRKEEVGRTPRVSNVLRSRLHRGEKRSGTREVSRSLGKVGKKRRGCEIVLADGREGPVCSPKTSFFTIQRYILVYIVTSLCGKILGVSA